LSRGWFRRRYLQRLEHGDLVIVQGLDDRCVFLEADGHCRVYPARPLQCRTYPFWPEVMRSKSAWQQEQRRCEGINHGPEVAPGRIRKMLQACREQAD
jgi:Fe-S-cluster containining protein